MLITAARVGPLGLLSTYTSARPTKLSACGVKVSQRPVLHQEGKRTAMVSSKRGLSGTRPVGSAAKARKRDQPEKPHAASEKQDAMAVPRQSLRTITQMPAAKP